MIVPAMIHSKGVIEAVEIIERLGNNEYIVMTEDGIKCHAIFNIFTGLWYADDKYAVIEN